jgi:hypothetical protein
MAPFPLADGSCDNSFHFFPTTLQDNPFVQVVQLLMLKQASQAISFRHLVVGPLRPSKYTFKTILFSLLQLYNTIDTYDLCGPPLTTSQNTPEHTKDTTTIAS